MLLGMSGPSRSTCSKRFKMIGLAVGAVLASGFPAAIHAQQPNAEPIHLDPANPHYFQFRGQTMALVGSGEHYGAVLNLDVDGKRYLDTVQSAGLNYTRIFGGSYAEVPGKSFGIQRNDLAPAPGRFLAPWARSATPGYAGGGNKFDLDHWNPAYFTRLHDFLADAASRGIVVEISLFSSQYGDAQWALSPFNSANNVNATDLNDWKKVNTLENGAILRYQEAYTRKLVREANQFDNVIFEIQNEPWSDRPQFFGVINPYLFPPGRDQFPNSIEIADASSLAWQQKIAEWITSEEANLPNRHLIAQCYTNFGAPVRSVIPGVSIVNFHYARPEAAIWNLGLNKAISYDETGFLGHGDTAYRRQAWNFMLSGGSVFDGLDYSFTPGHEDGTDTAPNGPGGGSPALRAQLKILRQFLQSLPLAQMRPNAEAVIAAPGVIPRVLAFEGHAYGIYLDGAGPTHLVLRLPTGDYSMQWIDVVGGAITKSETIRSTGSNSDLDSPPFDDGIALRIERAAP